MVTRVFFADRVLTALASFASGLGVLFAAPVFSPKDHAVLADHSVTCVYTTTLSELSRFAKVHCLKRKRQSEAERHEIDLFRRGELLGFIANLPPQHLPNHRYHRISRPGFNTSFGRAPVCGPRQHRLLPASEYRC